MNLFNHIANAPVAKSPLAEAASQGNAAVRPNPAGLNSTDFSKYLRQLMDAKVHAKPLDMQRQDLAGQQPTASTDALDHQDRRDMLARDARFESPRTKSQASRAETRNAERQSQRAADATNKASEAETDEVERLRSGDVKGTSTDAQETALETDLPRQALETTSPAKGDTGLKAVALSPRVQVITTDTPATTDASLAEFARSMGMSDSTLQQLLGGTAPVVNPLNESTQTPLTLGTQRPETNGFTLTAWPAGSILQSLMGPSQRALPSNPLTDMSTAGLAAQADASEPLNAILSTGIERVSIQIGALTTPATQASWMATTTTNTLAVLSMLDTEFTPEAIDALQQAFEANPGTSTEDHPLSGSGLLSTGSRLPGGSTSLPVHATSPAPASQLAETYEKLSDKLVTELAARLHQQISDGQWKMKFGLKPASLGAVDIQLEMRDGKLAALFQADNPLTQDLLQNGSQRLKDALHGLGISQTSVQVGQGHAQGHSQGQSQTSSDGAKFGDNRGQTHDSDPNTPVGSGHRRSSDSQFDIYA